MRSFLCYIRSDIKLLISALHITLKTLLRFDFYQFSYLTLPHLCTNTYTEYGNSKPQIISVTDDSIYSTEFQQKYFRFSIQRCLMCYWKFSANKLCHTALFPATVMVPTFCLTFAKLEYFSVSCRAGGKQRLRTDEAIILAKHRKFDINSFWNYLKAKF